MLNSAAYLRYKKIRSVIPKVLNILLVQYVKLGTSIYLYTSQCSRCFFTPKPSITHVQNKNVLWFHDQVAASVEE